MSTEVASINVVFEDDDNQESLLYSGETTLSPIIRPVDWTVFGTPIRFRATTPMLVPDILSGKKERFQTITFMKVYSGKSIDELRLEDYQYLARPRSSTSSLVFNTQSKTGKVRKPRSQQADYWLQSSAEVRAPSPMSTDSVANGNSEVLPRHTFSLTPTIDFTSQSTTDPCDVFKQPTQILTSSEGRQLMDCLLESIVKCMQIQNSLYRLVLLRLDQHVTNAISGVTDASDLPEARHTERLRLDQHVTDTISGVTEASNFPEARHTERLRLDQHVTDAISGVTEASDLPEVPHTERLRLDQHVTDAISGVTEASDLPGARHTESVQQKGTYDPGVLLCDLKEPLGALMRCADIQRGLFQRMIAVNLMTSEDLSDESLSSTHSQETPTVTEPQINMLAVQTDVEEIVFKSKVLCDHARNPFTGEQLKASSSEDVIQHISEEKGPFSVRLVNSEACSQRKLPHGYGSLKTATGKVIYSGDWQKGKRHGKGEGVIFSLSQCCSKPSTDNHGFYTGGWKNNMRHGSGKMTFVSGAVYEGQWQYDKTSGYGTLKFPDGAIQRGTWKEGFLDGCVLFTWPHGVTEYREYEPRGGQLSSCKIDEDTAGQLSQMSSIRSQLSNLRDCLTRLKEENIGLKDEMNTLKTQEAEMTRIYEGRLCEIRQTLIVQREQEFKKLREEFEKKLKDSETSFSTSVETIRVLEKQLEQSREAHVCQICFERPRDCIIMPCTHLLYCRTCVTEHKKKGDSRCPTCRGPISGEILCNFM